MARRNGNRLMLVPLLAALLLVASTVATARSVGYHTAVVRGARVYVVTVDLNDPRVKVSIVTAPGFPYGNESFSSMMYRAQPSAAITGTYFSKASLRPVGDIVIDGRYRYFGGLGTALALTPYNDVTFKTVPYGRRQDWRQFETVLAAGPRLLREGKVALAPRNEGFRDPHVLGRARRTAVGLTREHKLLLVATPKSVSLYQWAKIMRALGCVEAINLDGGSSAALYFDGSFILRPRRKLVNVLVVHEDVPLLARATTRMSAQHRREYRGWLLAKAHEHFEAGERLLGRDEVKAAVENYYIAARLAPDNASYAVALGCALEAQGNSRDGALWAGYAGRILVDKEKYAEAIAALGQALRAQPLHVEARLCLAAAYQGVGEHSAAARQVLAAREAQRQLLAPAREPLPHIALAAHGRDMYTARVDAAGQARLARALTLWSERNPMEAVRMAWALSLGGGPREAERAAAIASFEPAPVALPMPFDDSRPAPDRAWDEEIEWGLLAIFVGQTPYIHERTDFAALMERQRERAVGGGRDVC